MTVVEIISLVLKASIFLNVFAFALNAHFADATYLFRNPGLLLRAVLSMNVVMLLTAIALSLAFDLHPATKIALVTLSMSPVPPILPKKAFKAGGTEPYVIGLLTAAALLSIVFVPLSLELVQRIAGIPMGMSPIAVASIVILTVLAPLLLGVAFRALAPRLAVRISKPLAIVAFLILLVGSVPILIAIGSQVWALVGSGAVIAMTAFVVVGLLTGHVLGGPDPENRRVLALATSSRHPGLAIAIAHANFPQQKLTMGAVIMYLLLSIIVSVPYMKWSEKQQPTMQPGA